MNKPQIFPIPRSFLFLGYGPISMRIIDKISILENPDIHLITDQPLIPDLHENVRVWKPSTSAKLLTNFSFDFVINSWRSLSTISQINRKQFLLDLASSEARRTRFINFSTVAVYGDSPEPRLETSKLAPINAYGFEKLEIEMLIKNLNFFHVQNLRIANVFGDAKLRDVLNKIIFAANNESPIILTEPRKVFRDFIHIEDLVDVVINEINTVPLVAFESINVGRGSSLSLFELFEICNIEYDSKLTFTSSNFLADQIKVSRVNTEKLQSRYLLKRDSIQNQLRSYVHEMKKLSFS